MNILIVYAHPNHEGLNYEILKRVQDGFSKNHKVETIDLYELGFDPVLIFNTENKRRDLSSLEYTKIYRDKISEADKIIFIYPIWWSGMPAILKGFIDRVFTSGFAFSYDGRKVTKLLKEKTAWIINTHDRPDLYVKLFQEDYGKVLKNQILKLCGISKTRHISLPYTIKAKPKKIDAFLNKISKLSSKL